MGVAGPTGVAGAPLSAPFPPRLRGKRRDPFSARGLRLMLLSVLRQAFLSPQLLSPARLLRSHPPSETRTRQQSCKLK